MPISTYAVLSASDPIVDAFEEPHNTSWPSSKKVTKKTEISGGSGNSIKGKEVKKEPYLDSMLLLDRNFRRKYKQGEEIDSIRHEVLSLSSEVTPQTICDQYRRTTSLVTKFFLYSTFEDQIIKELEEEESEQFLLDDCKGNLFSKYESYASPRIPSQPLGVSGLYVLDKRHVIKIRILDFLSNCFHVLLPFSPLALFDKKVQKIPILHSIPESDCAEVYVIVPAEGLSPISSHCSGNSAALRGPLFFLPGEGITTSFSFSAPCCHSPIILASGLTWILDDS